MASNILDGLTSPEFTEVITLIGILFITVIGYIITGMVDAFTNNGESFDKKKFFNGILKAFTACCCLILISYAFTIIDLSSLGFYPKTAITSGIIVYTGKLVGKAMRLLGLTITGKEIKKDASSSNDNTESEVEESDVDLNDIAAKIIENNKKSEIVLDELDIDEEDTKVIDNGVNAVG